MNRLESFASEAMQAIILSGFKISLGDYQRYTGDNSAKEIDFEKYVAMKAVKYAKALAKELDNEQVL